MKQIKRTKEYTIFQKRSERYSVKSTEGKWINGDDKIKILLKEKLIKAAALKAKPAPVEEAPKEAAAEEKAVTEEKASEEKAQDSEEAKAE